VSTRLAVDVGGTFTDVVATGPDGATLHEKVPTTPGDVTRGILDGLERVGADPALLDRLLHGTTVALNAVLEGATAPVGLITTRGFRDVLEIRRTSRPDMYDLQQEAPVPLVPRRHRFEIGARMGPGGEELAPVDVDEVRAIAARLREAGIGSVAVCLINAYADTRHERAVGALLADAAPGLLVSLSTDLAREWREFERTSTAVVNAATLPVLGGYLDRLQSGLAERRFAGELMIMQSSGGVMSAESARTRPAATLMSGPVGGVVGARAIAEALGGADLVTVDIGGTSADVAVLDRGLPVQAAVGGFGRWPILMPMVDIRSVGAGGGSLARVDAHGALLVGPESAAAVPGPACYGRGGTRPTVTDANVVLGRIAPEGLMRGRLALDVEAAARAIATHVAEPLGLGVGPAAEGILRVMNSNTARLLREVLTEGGHDPRRFSLLAFGGGGGLHACALAEEAGLAGAIVPPHPGTMSALGILGAGVRHDRSAMFLRPVTDVSDGDLEQAFAALLGELRADSPLREAVAVLSADLRYVGQGHTLPVGAGPAPSAAAMAEEFHREHRRLFGVSRPDAPTELVRLSAALIEPAPAPARHAPGDGPAGERTGGAHARAELAVGAIVHGPSRIEEDGATTWVADGWTARIDAHANIVLERVA